MKTTLTLVVDRADVGEDHSLYGRQERGITTMEMIAGAFPAIQLVKTSTKGKPRIVKLMETAIEYAMSAGTHHFVGFLNSDLLVQTSFAESMSKWGDYDAIRVRRTDVPGGPLLTPSAEGIIMKEQVWLEHRSSLPQKLVIGEPGWDTCWIAWLHMQKLKVARLDNGEVLHPAHEQTWDKKSYWHFDNTKIMFRWMSRMVGRHRARVIFNYQTNYWNKIDKAETVIK